MSVNITKPADAFQQFVIGASGFPQVKHPVAPVTPQTVKVAKEKAASKPVAVVTDWKQWATVRGICYNVRNLQSGTRLFSYTSAWLAMTSMIDGKVAPHRLVAALGGSALSHHTKQGNMQSVNGMVSLTAKGINYFRARETGDSITQHVDPAMKEAFILMMLSGTTDGVLVNGNASIVKL